MKQTSKPMFLHVVGRDVDPASTGRVRHDARGNSYWCLTPKAIPEDYRDTPTWVMRKLEVPGLELDTPAVQAVTGSDDPYNRPLRR